MDKSEALALGLSAVLLLVFFVAIIYASTARGIDVPTCITDPDPFQRGQLIEHAEDRYEVQMIAQMWSFQPRRIEIPAGSQLDIYLRAADILHGFKIEGTNINMMAVPGSINYMQLTFDEPGTYPLICHEYCGVGHHNMRGEIVVTES